jgi:hypothetical protein
MLLEVLTFCCRHLLCTNVLRFCLGDVRRHVGCERLKIFGSRHKIRFAVYFYQDALLAVPADISRDQTLLGSAPFLLAGRPDALLAQLVNRCIDIAVRCLKRFTSRNS